MKVVTIREGANIKVIVQADNSGSGGSGSDSFDGNRPITAEVIGFEGVTPGTTTINTFLEATFYPSEAPTASATLTLDGTTSGSNRTKEMNAGGTEISTMNWTANRLATGADLSTILVDGIAQTYTPPAQGASVNGSQGVNFPSNTNKSIVLLVTDADGKTASDTISVSFKWKQYLGFTATNAPNDATVNALDNSFISSPNFDGTILNGGGSQYFSIVFPLSLEPSGGVTIKLGGFDITGDFNRTTRTFFNSSGGSSSHVFLVSTNQTNGDYNDLEIIS